MGSGASTEKSKVSRTADVKVSQAPSFTSTTTTVAAGCQHKASRRDCDPPVADESKLSQREQHELSEKYINLPPSQYNLEWVDDTGGGRAGSGGQRGSTSLDDDYSPRSDYDCGGGDGDENYGNAEMFSHTALSLDMDNEELLFNMMYFNGGAQGMEDMHFGNMLDNMQQETLALHSENNTPYKLKPAAESTISALKVETYGDNTTDTESECLICRDDLEAGCPIIRLPLCEHYFHDACLLRWIKMQAVCPVCRSALEEGTHAAAPPPIEEEIEHQCGIFDQQDSPHSKNEVDSIMRRLQFDVSENCPDGEALAGAGAGSFGSAPLVSAEELPHSRRSEGRDAGAKDSASTDLPSHAVADAARDCVSASISLAIQRHRG